MKFKPVNFFGKRYWWIQPQFLTITNNISYSEISLIILNHPRTMPKQIINNMNYKSFHFVYNTHPNSKIPLNHYGLIFFNNSCWASCCNGIVWNVMSYYGISTFNNIVSNIDFPKTFTPNPKLQLSPTFTGISLAFSKCFLPMTTPGLKEQ